MIGLGIGIGITIGNKSVGGGGVPATEQIETFTTPGSATWTAPSGLIGDVTVECWGGGGSGKASLGGGGSGGAYASSSLAIAPGASVPYVVGGVAGDTTWNTIQVKAKGGITATSDSGANAYLATASTGQIRYAGGQGGSVGGGIVGGGGSSAGTGTHGTAGSGANGGVAPAGGGNGGNGTAGAGEPGQQPGGGGGGSGFSGDGGSGAAGKIRITYLSTGP